MLSKPHKAAVPKPTGAQLYKRWMDGRAIISIAREIGDSTYGVEDALRAALKETAEREREGKTP